MTISKRGRLPLSLKTFTLVNILVLASSLYILTLELRFHAWDTALVQLFFCLLLAFAVVLTVRLHKVAWIINIALNVCFILQAGWKLVRLNQVTDGGVATGMATKGLLLGIVYFVICSAFFWSHRRIFVEN